MEKLFTNYNEYADFANALAYRRIKNLERTNSHFNEEIDETNEKCAKILEKYGVDTNLVSELIDLEISMQSSDTPKINSVDLEKLSLRREEYNSLLSQLPLEVREDLEFNYKKITDRKLRLKQSLILIDQIKTEYPKAENLTVIEIMDQPIFQSIEDFKHGDVALEESNKEVEATSNLPYVVQIKKAPERLLNPELKAEESALEPVKEKTPKESLEIPNLFMEDDELKGEIEDIPLFTELPEQPTDKIEVKDDLIEPQYEEDKIFTAFENLPTIQDEKTVEEELKTVQTESSENELTYTMEPGDTLANIALAICDDENGWYDIFAANKEVLEQRLKEAGLSSTDPFENNEEIFAGLTLNIPNVYEKGNQAKGLAA